MTPLERWDEFSALYNVDGGSYRTVPASEIRRALAIAQAVEEEDGIGDEDREWLHVRADELLKGGR